jgi:hypothetical protein
MRRLGRVCWRGGREGGTRWWWLKVGYEVWQLGVVFFFGDDANSYINNSIAVQVHSCIFCARIGYPM